MFKTQASISLLQIKNERGCIGRSSSFILMINRHESVVVLGIIPNVNVLLSYLQ